MALKIVQVNIRNWKVNKYFLQCELPNVNPDVILVNETGIVPGDRIKLQGFRAVWSSLVANSGVAILVRTHIPFSEIPLRDDNTLAVRVMTGIGPMIICTAYIPPRLPALPIVALNRVLNYNIPTIIAGDFNVHHPFLFNARDMGAGDPRGRQLYNLATVRQCTCLGPHFDTYISGNGRGTPDVVLANRYINILHTDISPMCNVGSDHIPILITLSTSPIRFLTHHTRENLNTLDIPAFKTTLSTLPTPVFHNGPTQNIDTYMTTVIETIKTASHDNTQKLNIKTTKNIPTYTQNTPKIETASGCLQPP